jgi:hypothetical protein
MEAGMTYQRRYLAYCRAHGMTPEAMLERDGNMVEFMAWNGARLREWREGTGIYHPLTEADQEAYTAWLERLPAPAEQEAQLEAFA